MIPEKSDLEFGNESYSNPKKEKTVIKNSDNTWKKIFAFCLIVFGIAFIYLISQGHFSNDNNQNVELEPNHTLNTKNDYKFNPETDNKYNFTIHNHIDIDEELIESVSNRILEKMNETS